MKKTGNVASTVLTKKSKVDLHNCPKRRRSEGKEQAHESQQEQAQIQEGSPYKSRLLICPGCGEGIETVTMQLLCPQGFRDIHCGRCKYHGRTKDLKCTCGCRWHLCDIHRQEPATHRSGRAPTREKDKKQEEAELKDSDRKTPEAAMRTKKALKNAEEVAGKKVFVHQGSQHLMRQIHPVALENFRKRKAEQDGRAIDPKSEEMKSPHQGSQHCGFDEQTCREFKVSRFVHVHDLPKEADWHTKRIRASTSVRATPPRGTAIERDAVRRLLSPSEPPGLSG